MLDLATVAAEVKNVGSSARLSNTVIQKQLTVALSLATVDSNLWSSSIDQINGSKTAMACAILTGPENVATRVPANTISIDYTIVAADGSQIPLDRHSPLPYFLINIGCVSISYGSDRRPHLFARPLLFHNEEDVLRDGIDGERSYVTETHVAQTRNALEVLALSSLISEIEDDNASAALIDGPLVLWVQNPSNKAQQIHPGVKELSAALKLAQIRNTAVAGYISRPGSREVITLLRKFEALIRTGQSGDSCELNRITDAMLFEHILMPGDRSVVFESGADILKSYDDGQKRIGFYYLNIGHEIARVEIPLYADTIEKLASLTQSIILDQIGKGGGYPIALIEAHEQAVVRAPDRLAVALLIERELIRQDIAVTVTRKQLSKRIRPI